MENQFMARAIELAMQNINTGRGGPFAAVVVRDQAIIAEGANEVTLRNDPTAHAEIIAIRNACTEIGDFRLSGCELYSSCEPCPMCLGALYWSRVDRVFFASWRDDAAAAGFDDAFIYRELQRPLQTRALSMIGMMRNEAQAVFAAWAAAPNRVAY